MKNLIQRLSKLWDSRYYSLPPGVISAIAFIKFIAACLIIILLTAILIVKPGILILMFVGSVVSYFIYAVLRVAYYLWKGK